MVDVVFVELVFCFGSTTIALVTEDSMVEAEGIRLATVVALVAIPVVIATLAALRVPG